jgi:TRAP-type transport system periplasmic protein
MRIDAMTHSFSPLLKKFTALMAICVACLQLPAIAQSADEPGRAIALKFNHTDSPSGTRHRAAELFASKVAEYTRGRYRVLIFHSGQLGNDPKTIEALQVGGIDFTVSATGSYASLVPTLNLAMLPYLVGSYEQRWKLYDDSAWLKAQMSKLPEKGLRHLSTFESGFRSFTTKTPLASPDDANNKTMRVFPNEIVKGTMESIGFKTLVMPVTEVYRAIQQDKVVGQENPIDTIYAQRFFEVAPHITLTQHIYSPTPLMISEKTWAKLSAADRNAVTRAAREAADFSRKATRDNDRALLDAMTAKGAKVARPDIAPFRNKVTTVYADARKKYGEDVDKFLADAAVARK